MELANQLCLRSSSVMSSNQGANRDRSQVRGIHGARPVLRHRPAGFGRSLVDGDHYFDTIADDAEFEFRYHFPGWPQTPRGRDALMPLYADYGNNLGLHGAAGLVVHRTQ